MSDCPPKPNLDMTPVADIASNVVVSLPPGRVTLYKKGDKRPSGDSAMLPTIAPVIDPPGFSYSQTSTMRDPETGKTPSRKERLAYGCRLKPGTRKSRGFTGENAFGAKDPFCGGSLAWPCDSDRFKVRNPEVCPVQMIFKDGQRMLRFCSGYRKAGSVLPVGGPREALELASEACEHWSKNLTWDGLDLLEGAALSGWEED